jgi:hypothetical protein
VWSAGADGRGAPRAFLGMSRIGWVGEGGRVAWEPADGVLDGVSRLLRRVSPGVSSGKTAPLAMLLSGAVARPFNVGPVHGLRRWSEARLIAQSLAPQLTGHPPGCEVWMDESPAERAVLAVAMESAVLQALHDGARSAGIRWTSLRPWWSLALSQAMAQHDVDALHLLAVDDGDALTLLRRAGPTWEPSTCWPRPERAQVATLLMRQAAASNLPNEVCRYVDLHPSPGGDAVATLAAADEGEGGFFKMRFRSVEALVNDDEQEETPGVRP